MERGKMNIEHIIKIIEEAMQENLETVVLLLLVVSCLYATNILFGTILGSFTEKFFPKKFFFGILKGILGCVGVFTFCYTLNLFSLALQTTKDISISTDIITTLEVVCILIVWCVDLAKDIIEKLKSFKVLKYVSYDDVQVMENPQDNKELG